ncbi:hypothetical protein MM236_17235, partial [Belliella sp. DSM 107340]
MRRIFTQNALKTCLLISFLLICNLSKGQITPFTMSLSPTDQTCTGNGQILAEINGTQPGAEFEFQLYQLPNLAVPLRVTSGITASGNSLTHVETLLSPSNYRLIAVQVVGVQSNQEFAEAVVGSNIQSLNFNLTQTETCGGKNITVNVTSGFPATFELLNLSNTVVVGPQASNVLTGISAGDYIVRVTDVCGNASALGVTVTPVVSNYTFTRGTNAFGFYFAEDCDFIDHTINVRYNGGAVTPAYRYPLQITYEIENPLGGANIIYNTTWNASQNQEHYPIPFYENASYNVTATVVDACGVTFTRTDLVDTTIPHRGRLLDAECGTRYLRLDQFRFLYQPLTVTFTDYPASFDPADFNSSFTAGTYSATFNSIPNFIDFGNPNSLGLPEGSYTYEVESCGRIQTNTVTVTNSSNYFISTRRYFPGCEDGEGSVNLFINGDADNFTSVVITAAPPEFITNFGALPFDASHNIASNGDFYMNSLPVGNYTVAATGECGIPINGSFIVRDKEIDLTSTVTQNCGSFNVSASLTSYLGQETLLLQKFYPASGQWGHPTTGQLYTEGNNITSGTGMPFWPTSNNGSGLQTLSGTINNITSSGQFRLIVQYITYNGNGLSTTITCRDTLDTFNISSTGISLNNYYVANCIGGNTELVIDAEGVAPLNFKIVEFNGSPMVIDNGEDPVFSQLATGEYTVEVEDACGNIRVFDFKTDAVKEPIIRPDNLCVGENGTLFVPGLTFMTIEWRKDGDPTVIATGNTLNFNPFTDPADAGTYTATLIYDPNPNACINQVLSFEVQSPAPAPLAGTGQTVNIPQDDAGIMNLFDYITGPYDNFGDWTDLSNTGQLNNEVLDASTLSVGTYQFEYTIGGICVGSESTIVTVNIISSSLTAVTDAYNVLCPSDAYINVINVMDNDVMAGILINQTEYEVSVEVADPDGILTLNTDGSVDVAAGNLPLETYTLQYRVYQISNPNNFAIGTLTVSISEDDTPPVFVEALPAENRTVECDEVPVAAILTATDNCTDDVTVIFEETRTDGSCDNNYVLTRTWTVTDDYNNIATHTQTITVEDTKAPTGTAPIGQTDVNACASAAETALPFDALAVATNYSDNCAGAVTVTLTNTELTGNDCAWTLTYTYQVADTCGNLLEDETITYSGSDQTAPTGTAPQGQVDVDACASAAETAVPFDALAVATNYTDNCAGAVTVTLTDTELTGNDCAWTLTYTYQVADTCGNLLEDETITYSGSDQTAPTGTAPQGQVDVDACASAAETAVPFDAVAVATNYTDNCAGAVTVTLTNTELTGNDCAWTLTYTYQVADTCGNLLEDETITYSGSDQTAPTGTAPIGQTDVDACVSAAETAVPFDAVAVATNYTDNCAGAVTVTLTNTELTGNDCAW